MRSRCFQIAPLTLGVAEKTLPCCRHADVDGLQPLVIRDRDTSAQCGDQQHASERLDNRSFQNRLMVLSSRVLIGDALRRAPVLREDEAPGLQRYLALAVFRLAQHRRGPAGKDLRERGEGRDTVARDAKQSAEDKKLTPRRRQGQSSELMTLRAGVGASSCSVAETPLVAPFQVIDRDAGNIAQSEKRHGKQDVQRDRILLTRVDDCGHL